MAVMENVSISNCIMDLKAHFANQASCETGVSPSFVLHIRCWATKAHLYHTSILGMPQNHVESIDLHIDLGIHDGPYSFVKRPNSDPFVQYRDYHL